MENQPNMSGNRKGEDGPELTEEDQRLADETVRAAGLGGGLEGFSENNDVVEK